MIQISGKPFEKKDLWKSDSIESVIIKRMQEAKVIYSYQTLAELVFELKFRKHIINSSIEMSKSKAKFNILKNSRGNPQYWVMSPLGEFQLRLDVKPSDAIRDIFMNSSLYTFECATSIIIIYYYALLKMIGETKFDQYFRNISLYSWHLDSDYRIHTFYGEHVLPGDVLYVNNPDVNPKTFWWRGQNVVDLGDGTYFGHGFSIRTPKEMIELLNEKRKPESQTSAYLTSLITRPLFKDLLSLSAYPRTNETYKMQHRVIHHDQCSIAYAQYLAYFNVYI
ncbi:MULTISPECIES: protein-glutamine gamma-glutamyltransferase [unclassified Bacillus (in: firmicutes)]|uniref:protein-glutamine gamma-glutamyltransferase n=1 Tax=unclassified Bacillus (in: firmicutes) TaxID=185979 RepID=UPI0008E45431|nr:MULTISPECIES: protein-glutamine gamma-glutamyltransferase [unclassified Bacillus (in: firmicutes)]SFB04332.1 protein-glutamine gamma-glutamyltransferase [Bacillus sp. UNCCL13]SFQ88520.1 protein-glutamine gamma-glutamyltransferase [Bacillus sp. cl95]